MPANRGNVAHNIMPPHYLHELPAQEEERLENMFKKLDLDGNGRIDVHDLSKALREVGVDKKYAEKFLARSDKTNSGDITLGEFIHYIREHEKHLQLQFSHVDKNNDGKIDLEELIKAFEELGINIERKKAMKLLQRMDKDGSLNISFNEWRDFLVYAPSTDLSSIIEYWNHAMFMDSGDEISVPEIVSGSFVQHFVAGAIAGIVSRTCTAPLDRVKVFLQVHGGSIKRMKTCVKYMYKEGGVTGFWRGNGINVIKVAPETAIKFAVYERIKKVIKGSDSRELALSERFLAGSIAGGISQSAIYPLEVLKTRFALGKTGEFTALFASAKRIYQQGGVKVFYRGYVPNLIGIIPYAGIDLAVYETLKNSYLKRHNRRNKPGVWVFLFCGIASSSAGQVCTYPLALARTRLQAQMPPNSPNTAWGVLCDIVMNEGFRGLYRGLTPNFLKVAPAVSVSYIVYETLREAFGVDMT